MTDFALFDLLSPALKWLDDLLRDGLALAPVWRIAVFAALGSVASMSLFKALSDQAALAELKRQIRAVQKELARPATQSRKLKEVIQQNLKLTIKQMWLSLWPALIASVPLLFLLAFCSNAFGVTTPQAGFRVTVTPQDMNGSASEYQWQGVNAQWDARKNAWTFYQPGPGQSASLMLGGQKQLTLPTVVATRVIHRKHWWNYLIANPAGYLDANLNIGQFVFNTPIQVIIDWGPGWMRGWLFAFMLFLVLFSIVIKLVWKIH